MPTPAATSTDPSGATTEAEPAPPTEEAADPQVEAAVTEPAAPAPAEPAAAPAEPAPAPAASTPASVDTARPTTTDSAAAGIRVQARQNAWVSITDANDDKLVYGEVTAGSERSVSGKPPYRIVIGNAQHAQLFFNGQPVDLASKTKGSTAKLTLE